MKPQDLARAAHTVECFLNALRLEDDAARAALEEALVRWLADDRRRKEDHLIYHEGKIHCCCGDQAVRQMDVPAARQEKTLWCNRKEISILDRHAWRQGGKLVMLGTAGLVLGLPGALAAGAAPQRGELGESGELGFSNNNNNNNNNG